MGSPTWCASTVNRCRPLVRDNGSLGMRLPRSSRRSPSRLLTGGWSVRPGTVRRGRPEPNAPLRGGSGARVELVAAGGDGGDDSAVPVILAGTRWVTGRSFRRLREVSVYPRPPGAGASTSMTAMLISLGRSPISRWSWSRIRLRRIWAWVGMCSPWRTMMCTLRMRWEPATPTWAPAAGMGASEAGLCWSRPTATGDRRQAFGGELGHGADHSCGDVGGAAVTGDDRVPGVAGQLADLGHDRGAQPRRRLDVLGGELADGSPQCPDLREGGAAVRAGALVPPVERRGRRRRPGPAAASTGTPQGNRSPRVIRATYFPSSSRFSRVRRARWIRTLTALSVVPSSAATCAWERPSKVCRTRAARWSNGSSAMAAVTRPTRSLASTTASTVGWSIGCSCGWVGTGNGAAAQVVAAVDHDPDQPGEHRGVLAEPGQRLPRVQQRLLHDVLCVLDVPGHPQRDGVQPVLVNPDQRFEGRLVPLASQLDEGGVQMRTRTGYWCRGARPGSRAHPRAAASGL